MADSVFVKVNGLRELGESMRLLSAEMNYKIARRATGKAAHVIREAARQKAPVAPAEVTPKVPYASLRENIVAKYISRTAFTSEHMVLVRGGRAHDYASKVASLQEFGTVKMRPQPFMRPAFDEKGSEAVAVMKKTLADSIERALSR